MLSKTSLPCFDAGSDYCPCALASLGQCISCSMLHGEITCDCGWNGVCIFDEFLRNGKTHKPPRSEVTAIVEQRRDISGTGKSNAFLAKLGVPAELARWCLFPGSFIMLRPESTNEYFNVPLSVVEASTDGRIEVAIEVIGPKTVALERAMGEGHKVIVKGPYWSGLQGLSELARLNSGKALIVSKGMGQATVPQIAKYILRREGNLKVLIGPGNLGKVFIDEKLTALGAPFEILPRSADHNLGYIKTLIDTEQYDLIISAGSGLQHTGIREITAQRSSSVMAPKMLWTSHLTMNCAEGICGSCLLSGFRGCKAQFDTDIEPALQV